MKLLFCFGSHDLQCTMIENTFWVIFRPRGCSGVLYFVLEKDYTVTWNQTSVIIPPCNIG